MRFRIKRPGNSLIWAVAASTFLIVSAAMASAPGFPGQGNPADWSDALPYYNLANKMLNEGRYSEAVDKYRDAISRYEFDPDFYVNLGVAYRKLEAYAEAEHALKRAVELNPKDWVAWSDLGDSYLKQDMLEDAQKTFERALTLNPPEGDKKWMLDDIRDIKKLLSFRQKQNPAAVISKNVASGAKSGSKNSVTNKPSPATSITNTTVKSKQSSPQLTPESLKESGWDWSYK